jgi:hypothetical protein
MSTERNELRVFISYSHNTAIPNYKDRILALSDRLRSDGIDCSIDQYESAPPKGWPRWMLDRIEWADFVLVACSEEYNRRFRGNEAYGKGKGATWEGGVIVQELYDAQGLNTKFIPIILSPEDSEFIPSPLGGATYYRLQNDDGYDLLYRRLTNQHDTPVLPLGTVRRMPLRDRKQNFTIGLSLNDQERDRDEVITRHNSAAVTSTKSIRQLIETLSDDDLNDLCQDDFPQVFKQFTTGQTKSQRIRLLIEHVEKRRESLKLSDAIEQINIATSRKLISNEGQSSLVQHNTDKAQGFQTEVHGGTVYIGSTHIYGSPGSQETTSSDSSSKTDFDLSIEAREMLLAAFKSTEKTIKVSTFKNHGGAAVMAIRVGDYDFGNSPSLTNYQYAIEQLVEEKFVEQSQSDNRVSYKLKAKGYDFCIEYNKSLPAKALALQSAVNHQVATEIAEFKAIGQPIYYSKDGKLIREDADGRASEYIPTPDGGEELTSEV